MNNRKFESLSLRENVKGLAGHQEDTVTVTLKPLPIYGVFQKMDYLKRIPMGHIPGNTMASAFILGLLGDLRIPSAPVPEPGVDPP